MQPDFIMGNLCTLYSTYTVLYNGKYEKYIIFYCTYRTYYLLYSISVILTLTNIVFGVSEVCVHYSKRMEILSS